MDKQIRQLWGTVPINPEDYILASQISQAEAKKYFIERMRVGRPKKTGIIWWNLLDGWPQMSDAVVDYYFTKKLAYKYIKRSQAPFCIAADELSDWKIKLFACNDTLQPKAGHFTVTDAETNELLIDKDFTAEANASTCIGEIPVFYSAHKVLLIHWMIDGEAGFNHYLCGYPPFDLAWYKKILKEQIL
jgi:beta-mannosidase